VARAKQTARSEARRRYRQASSQPAEADTDALESNARPGAGAAKATPRQNDKPSPTPAGRPGFMFAVRGAYHPAHIAEDIRLLPTVLTHWSFLAAVALVLVGAVAAYLFPGYTGSAFAWELLVLPGSALAPQLVAGFFAKRASYLLGLIIGLVQGVVFVIFITQFAARVGTTLPTDQMGNLLLLAFVTGPISGTLFAAAAAWYRRFLALSSPRRPTPARGGSGRTPAKNNTQRRSGR
jgi:hypothetical protein